ncbi:hypothetical protein M422DRAFT_270575 [Sphaerobolus stellatus SS14]|uniref:Unplaced genomic scaffold SPHSTscaffold_238, whole genome shotgun sequence n=1 Tax=Sphaerobolus stellatus (strain SS14) TaxID=990650 RepID=A0A0C9USH3_SPHS4|nr:hypothetical protein M422DRAFT_270575 [Sphaerobolus stellatus SS14]
MHQVVTLDDTLVDAANSVIYHISNEGIKAGRSVIKESTSGREIVGDPYNVKTVVNSYGRAAATISNGLLYFNNSEDNRIYRKLIPEGETVLVSPDSNNFRFAHICIHPRYSELIVCIMEDHSCKPEAVTSLACINTETQTLTTLVSGSDFYVNPAFSLDGSKLAWIQWDYPNMQWHGAQLFAQKSTFIAGTPNTDAVFQAHWLPNIEQNSSTLLFTWDKDGLCEPWLWSSEAAEARPVLRRPHSIEGDFGLPVWWLDDSYFAFLQDGICICTTITRGVCALNILNLYTGVLQPIPNPFVTIFRLRRVTDSSVVFIATTAKTDAQIIHANFDESRWTEPTLDVLFSVDPSPLDEAYVSHGTSITVKKTNGQLTYANFYPPKHPDYIPLATETPPCILSLHSGPTYYSSLGFTWYRQYYTSRGFAWLDVEYSGSSGFGKEYRKLLDGRYGIIDVEDIVELADYVGSFGFFDRQRIALRSSSGGTLPELQTFTMHPTAFAAAAAHFPVADPAKLVPGPDKFSRHYIGRLMGGTPEEIPEAYKERSPVLHANKIKRPLQAELIVQAVKDSGGKVYFTTFQAIDSAAFKILYDVELAFFRETLVDAFSL